MKARTKKATLLPLVAIMRRSRIFCQGRGGRVQARRPENSLDNVFILVLNLYYSLQRGYNGFITEKTSLFQGSRESPNIFQGGQLFPEGKYI